MDSFDNGSIRGKLFAADWLRHLSYAGTRDIVQVQFKNTRNGFFRNNLNLDLHIGDIVAVEASPGHDIGRVMMTGPLVSLQMKKAGVSPGSDLKKVFRLARPSDMEKFQEARAKEHETMIRSRQIAAELELNMKIGDVEYQGDGGKAIFYYIADERVDFRKLIRILADTFKVRIEMKQIGARQEAGRIGGIGPCGRPLCCSSWMRKFVSVGTGAARLQDLSMNPQKLAGQCAKLKCCLNFETDVYAEAVKKLPPKDITLETQDATYYYFKPDILAGKVTYSTDKSIPANLVTIDIDRVKEIIEINRRGEKVLTLQSEEDAREPEREYIDLTDQDSLTRFDKSKRKKHKNTSKKEEPSRKEKKEPQPKKEQPKKDNQPKKENASKKDAQPKKDAQSKKEATPKKDAAPNKGTPRKEGTQQRDNRRQRDNRQRHKDTSAHKDGAPSQSARREGGNAQQPQTRKDGTAPNTSQPKKENHPSAPRRKQAHQRNPHRASGEKTQNNDA